MPNHIRNVVKPDNRYEEIASAILAEKEPKEGKEPGIYLDFEKIIPMPKHIFRGNLGQAEEEKYGKENCWYEWSIKNWGTKWGAYDYDEYSKYEEEFSFQTAWNHPTKVILELSKMYPDVEFDVKYADEDIGNNLGHYKIKDGEKTWEHTFTGNLSIEDEKELFARRIRSDR